MGKDDFFTFMEYVNEKTANSNEYSIARAIINNIDMIMDLTLEELANEASISKASASRFVKKMGFESFYDFKLHLHYHLTNISKYKNVLTKTKFAGKSDLEIAQYSYDEAITNLDATMSLYDSRKTSDFVATLINADDVTFVGDSRSLAAFYLIQLDLLGLGTPCYSFYNSEFSSYNLAQALPGSVIVYVTIAKEAIREEDMKILEMAKKKGVTLFGIFQRAARPGEDIFDATLEYGIPGDNHGGPYSLVLLANIVSNLMYMQHHK